MWGFGILVDLFYYTKNPSPSVRVQTSEAHRITSDIGRGQKLGHSTAELNLTMTAFELNIDYSCHL